VCTFEQCENPQNLYLTRHDWMYHETQMHRRQWICASCSHQKFSFRDDIKIHLLAKHAGQFPESQLMIMVDICERPMDDDEDADCPICLATLSLSALRAHLATHLEELALFVLPCHMEDRSQDLGSDKAGGVTGQRLASNASSSEDGLPPLDFETVLPDTLYSQDPEIFSTLLQSTMEFKQKHMEDWVLTNDQTEPPDDGDSIGAIAPLPEASTYRKQGLWDAAEELEAQVMETRTRVVGQEHPDTLASMDNLASTYRDQGRWKEAEELVVQMMETRKRVLGQEHPDTLASMNNLAFLLESQGKYDAAEPLYRETLQLTEKVLGKEHPQTLISMNNLAGVLHSRGKYDTAEPLYRETLQLRKKVLGKEHPQTLISMNNLAFLLQSQGKYDAAERLYWETLQLREKVLGKEYPDTLISINNLARVLESQGKYNAAEPLYRKTLQLREKVLGKEHPDTLISMNSLTRVLERLGKYNAAEPLYRETLG